MTSLQTREYRRQIARLALQAYQEWVTAETGGPLDAEIIGHLASVAQWYLEEQAEP